MQFLKVERIHEFEDEPYVIYAELDNERYEIRKLELYRKGKIGYATQTTEYEGSILAEHPYPPIEEIASDPEFIPIQISEEQFEEIWKEKVEKE